MRDSAAEFTFYELATYISPIIFELFKGKYEAVRREYPRSDRKLKEMWHDALSNPKYYNEETAKETADAIIKKLESEAERFSLESSLRSYVANTLCVSCGYRYKSCYDSISLHIDEVRKFVFMVLKRVARELLESQMIGSNMNYVERKETEKYVLYESMRLALLEFIVYYRDFHSDLLADLGVAPEPEEDCEPCNAHQDRGYDDDDREEEEEDEYKHIPMSEEDDDREKESDAKKRAELFKKLLAPQTEIQEEEPPAEDPGFGEEESVAEEDASSATSAMVDVEEEPGRKIKFAPQVTIKQFDRDDASVRSEEEYTNNVKQKDGDMNYDINYDPDNNPEYEEDDESECAKAKKRLTKKLAKMKKKLKNYKGILKKKK